MLGKIKGNSGSGLNPKILVEISSRCKPKALSPINTGVIDSFKCKCLSIEALSHCILACASFKYELLRKVVSTLYSPTRSLTTRSWVRIRPSSPICFRGSITVGRVALGNYISNFLPCFTRSFSLVHSGSSPTRKLIWREPMLSPRHSRYLPIQGSITVLF